MAAARSAARLVAVLLVVAVLAWAGRAVLEGRGGAALVPVTSAPYAAAVVAAPAPVAAPGGRPGVVDVDAGWVRRTAALSGVPETALAAYARASLRAPRGCGLGWTTLAGIGWIESQHGTIGDRVLGLDGRSSRPVVGPALDGQGGFAAIPSTPDGQVLHGDPTWDHAVGPMQFITSTWLAWGRDGDGDDVVDPQDLDDAAWAAARYLCADGRDLTTGAGWSAGIVSYNRSQSYLDDVYAAATTYAARTARADR